MLHQPVRFCACRSSDFIQRFFSDDVTTSSFSSGAAGPTHAGSTWLGTRVKFVKDDRSSFLGLIHISLLPVAAFTSPTIQTGTTLRFSKTIPVGHIVISIRISATDRLRESVLVEADAIAPLQVLVTHAYLSVLFPQVTATVFVLVQQHTRAQSGNAFQGRPRRVHDALIWKKD